MTYLHSAFVWVLAVVAVEAMTEIVVSSSLFFRFRNWVGRHSAFFGELLTCGYCFSVWSSAAIAWALPGDVFTGEYGFIANIAVRTLVLHRVSNFLHGLIKRICDRPPQEHVVSLFMKRDADGAGNQAGKDQEQV